MIAPDEFAIEKQIGLAFREAGEMRHAKGIGHLGFLVRQQDEGKFVFFREGLLKGSADRLLIGGSKRRSKFLRECEK